MDALSLPELANGCASAPLLDDAGRPVDPLLLVELDGPVDRALLRAARDAASATDRILIGIGTSEPPADEAWDALLTALDLTLIEVAPTNRATLVAADERRLLDAANANPQASLVLAQVLRASQNLDVREGLDLESFAYSTLLGGEAFRRWLDARGSRPTPPPAPAPPVLVERTADDLLITLNRPERRNAYGREVRDAFVDALRVAALDEAARVVITGEGPSFCSGGDLDEFGTAPDLVTAHIVRTRAGAGGLLHHIAGRTEVRLHGACVGAGIELAAFAGRVVAHPGTTVRLPEVGMGLIPGAGGTVSIPRRIGRWRTLYLALSGVTLDATTALEWELVDAVGE